MSATASIVENVTFEWAAALGSPISLETATSDRERDYNDPATPKYLQVRLKEYRS